MGVGRYDARELIANHVLLEGQPSTDSPSAV
jgi:hypothetical protein